ncbi:hypothetical protein E2F50_01040 [Rhizobium deserti]|uniref:Uncharacterized protein n=1 Tax=Rhizobium deserti TaxID=2547961 RepID=A0A4R5ULZ1_9HYPH|nr:hypothetical protein [Rhizobium deserti]TDK38769.1 hypothetical protein E2F50_01040 [Rhizobium deserti]
MDKSEILTNLGILVAGIFAGLIAYFGKKPPAPPHHPDTIVAGVGMEPGNRLQMNQLIAETKRCADSLAVLADRKQASTEAKLDLVLQELAEAEEGDLEAKARRAPRSPQQRKPRTGG